MTTLTQDLVIERVASSVLTGASAWVAFVSDVQEHDAPCLIEAFVALEDSSGQPEMVFKRWSNVPEVDEARSIAAEALLEMDERVERSISNSVEVSITASA
jgi:hypothetical protein